MKLVFYLFFLCCSFVWSQEFETFSPDNPLVLMKTTEGDIYLELFAKEAPKTVQNFIGLATGIKEFLNPVTLEYEKRPFFDGHLFYRIRKDYFVQTGDPLGTGRGGPGYSFEDEINAIELGLDKVKVFDKKGDLHLHLRDDTKEVQLIIERVLLPRFSKEYGVKPEMSEAEKRVIFEDKIVPRINQLSFKDLFEAFGYRFTEKLHSYPPKAGYLAMANSGPNSNGSRFFINLVDNAWLAGRNTVFGRVIKGMDIVKKMGLEDVDKGDTPKRNIRIINMKVLHKGKVSVENVVEHKSNDITKLSPDNPVFLMKTSIGDIYLELFAKSAPKTVKNFTDLALGRKSFRDAISLEKVKRPFYNGLRFYKVQKGVLLQTGDPLETGTGGPGYNFENEINAESLHLDQQKVFEKKNQLHSSLRKNSQQIEQVIQQIILPKLSKEAGISPEMSEEEAKKIFEDKILSQINQLSFKDLFEAFGYRFTEKLHSYPPKAGYLAMANSGPNSNGSRFFINLADNAWLAGRNTVFGRVIKGMDVVEKMAQVEVGLRLKPVEEIIILSLELLEMFPPKKE